MNVMLGEAEVLAALGNAWWSLLEVCFCAVNVSHISMGVRVHLLAYNGSENILPIRNYSRETDP